MLKYVSNHECAAYYSNIDEIVAYSHCIMLEIRREYPNDAVKDVIWEYGGETYDYIFDEVFENNFENKALNRYVSEVLRWEMRYK